MSSEFTQRDAENVTEAQEKLRKLGERQTEAQSLTPGQFPAHYFAKKKDEEKIRLVQDYIKMLNTPGQLTPGNNQNGVAALYTPTEDDINVIVRKDQEQRLVGFEAFLETFFDLKNPQHQKILNDVYPQYFDRRLEIINDNLKLQEKMARLKLYGPQTQEDIFFLFGLWQGDIEIPTELASALDARAFNEDKYSRGMFNAKKWARPDPQAKGPMGSVKLFHDYAGGGTNLAPIATGPFAPHAPRNIEKTGRITTVANGPDPTAHGYRPAIQAANEVFGRVQAGRSFVASIFGR